MALLTNEVRSATLRTLSHCKVLAITADDFHRLCETDPRLGYLVLRRMIQIVSERLCRSSHDVLNLTTALSLTLRSR